MFYLSVPAYQFPFVKKCFADASGKRQGERIFTSRSSSCIDPVSNEPFLHLICPLLPPVPFGFLQRFCRYFGSGPTLVNKVNPVKTGQDWPRPPKTPHDIFNCLYKCVPCLVTSFHHDLPSWLAKGKREEPLLILVQTTSIQASAVDHLKPLPNEVIPNIW